MSTGSTKHVDGSQVFEALRKIKDQHPELEHLLTQFQIDQNEYEMAMLQLLSYQYQPQNTYASGTPGNA